MTFRQPSPSPESTISAIRNLVFVQIAIAYIVMSSGTGFTQERTVVPSLEQQKKIEKLLEDTYDLASLTSSAKKQEAIKTLSAAAANPDLPGDERYVVLLTVIRLTRETGDLPRWLASVNMLVNRFDVAPRKEKSRFLVEYLEGIRTASSLKPVAEEAIETATAMAQAHDYAAALDLLAAADKTAKRLSDKNSPKLLADARKAIDEQKTDHDQQALARKALLEKPDDPPSNHAIGRWLALYEEDWPRASVFLAKGNDEKWRSAAQAEISMSSDTDSQLAVADAWWEITKTATGNAKVPLQRHTVGLYEMATETTKSPIVKTRIAQRLKDLGPVAKVVGATKPVVTPAAPTTTGSEPKASQSLDLLNWADGFDWAPRGINWNTSLEGRPSRDGITLKADAHARFPLPAIIEGDYDLEVEFTRFDGNQGVGIIFPVGDHNLHLELGSENGTVGGVSFIEGKAYTDFENPTRRRPAPVSNNQAHRVKVRVRHDGPQASFVIDFDNQEGFIKWEGKAASLINAESGDLRISMIRHVWLLSNQGSVAFHKASIRMLSSFIRTDIVTDAYRKQELTNGYVRLVSEKPRSVSAGWAQVLINQLPLEMEGPDIERTWPLITRDFRLCDDFYTAHAPSRLKCPIPNNAKCFTAVGFNDMSRTVTYRAFIDGKLAFDSSECGIAVLKIAVPPKSSLLELAIEAGENNHHDCSYWCYPRFHGVPLEKVSDKILDAPVAQPFTIASSVVGAFTLTHNKKFDGLTSNPLHFRSAMPCDEFIYSHAPSVVSFDVPEGMTRFTAIGYKEMFHHHVKFEVWADGGRIYQSPVAGIVPIDVKLPPRTKSIELKVDDLGNRAGDQSMWCYPRLYRQ